MKPVTTWNILLAASIGMIACGASQLPIWEIHTESGVQVHRGQDGNSAYLLEYQGNERVVRHINFDGDVLAHEPIPEAPSYQVLGRLGQTIWLADDERVSYVERDLLRAKALDLNTFSIQPALPNALRETFSSFDGLMQPGDQQATQAIYGTATRLGEDEARPVIALVQENGDSTYAVLEGDIIYHNIQPLPNATPATTASTTQFVVYQLYSQEHFDTTGTQSSIVFYDANLNTTQHLDFPFRAVFSAALPDRVYINTGDSPRHLDVFPDGTVSPAEDRDWNYRTQYLFHDAFFYSITYDYRGRSICHFSYSLEALGCFTPHSDYWLTNATLLPDGSLATTEVEGRTVINGIDIAFGAQTGAVSGALGGHGFQERHIIHRFYYPNGDLINEIPTPAIRHQGNLSLCSWDPSGFCLSNDTISQPGVCHANNTLPLSATAIIAVETHCSEGSSHQTLARREKTTTP